MKNRRLAFVLVGLVVSGCTAGAALGPSEALSRIAASAQSQTKLQFTFFGGIPASGPSHKVKSFRIREYDSKAPGHVWELAKEYYCKKGPQCSLSFNGDPTAPYAVESYDRSGAKGHLLSTSYVYLGQYGFGSVELTLDSAIAGIQVQFVPRNPAFGKASRVLLAAVASSSGNYIVGPAPYSNAVKLQVTAGNMRLSTTTLTSSARPAFLSYDGGSQWATVTASARTPLGRAKSSETVQPALMASERSMFPTAGQLAVASDGTVWVSSFYQCSLVSVRSDLSFHVYPMPASLSCPGDLTTGPDGNVWFSTSKGFIGHVASDGNITGYTMPSDEAGGLVTGSDGRLWMVGELGGAVYAMTTSGAFTTATFSVYPAENPRIAPGPDGNLWITNGPITQAGFDIVNTAGDLMGFVKAQVAEPMLGTKTYLYALTYNPKNQQTEIGKWDASRHLVARFPIGQGVEPAQFTVDASGALWFNLDNQTLGRISSGGAYCEFVIPKSTLLDNPALSGLVATPGGYLYYGRGAAVGKIKIPQGP